MTKSTSKTHYFSQSSLDFLAKAGKQKKPDWLDKNLTEYDEVLRLPFIEIAEKIKAQLFYEASDYHFPTKGIGRIKRPDFKVVPGQPFFKDWISLSAKKPSDNRFEHNPHLFLGIFPNDKELGPVLLAGGLWQPSSSQMRKIRHAIAQDSSEFHELFADKNFRSRFKDSFSNHAVAARVPQGFDSNHPDLNWIKLKSFVVLKKISVKDFSSKTFSDSVIKDFKQALRLNRLLEKALS